MPDETKYVDIDSIDLAEEAKSVDFSEKYASTVTDSWESDTAGDFAADAVVSDATGHFDQKDSYSLTADGAFTDTIERANENLADSPFEVVSGRSNLASTQAAAVNVSALADVEEVKTTDFAADAASEATDDYMGDSAFFEEAGGTFTEAAKGAARNAVAEGVVVGALADEVTAKRGLDLKSVGKGAAAAAFENIVDHDIDEVEGTLRSTRSTAGTARNVKRLFSKKGGRGASSRMHRKTVNSVARKARQAAVAKDAAAAAGGAAGGGFVATIAAAGSGIIATLMPVILAITAVLAAVSIGGALVSFIFTGAAADDTELADITAFPEAGLTEYLTRDAGETQGAKYWKWTVGSKFENGSDTPWCASFASWCGKKSGLYKAKATPKNAGVAGWVDWYNSHKDAGEVHKNDGKYEPQVGDLVIYDTSRHIGIVAGTSKEDTEYIRDLLKTHKGTTADTKARHDGLKRTLNAVLSLNNHILTIEGNTGDANGTGQGNNSLGIKNRPVGSVSITHYIHVFAPMTGSGDFPKYKLTDTEVQHIANLCAAEQGGGKAQSDIQNAAAEASLMANLYELGGKHSKSLHDWIRDCGWFAGTPGVGATGSDDYFTNGKSNNRPSKAQIKAIKRVLCDGKRTLPKYVNEHDDFGDLLYVSPGSLGSRKSFVQHKSVIYQNPDRFDGEGTHYYFYCFPDGVNGHSDPFGYTSKENRKKYGDECYKIGG